MSEIKIITNHHWRNFLYGYELALKWRHEFNYLTDEEYAANNFFAYHGYIYDTSEFMSTCGMPDDSPLKQWDGYRSESFFSGILVRYSENCEQYQVGRYLS